MTRAAHAAACDATQQVQEIAAHDVWADAPRTTTSRTSASSADGGRGMTLAQAAQKAIELGGKLRRS